MFFENSPISRGSALRDLIFNAFMFAMLGASIEVMYTGTVAYFKYDDERWRGHVSVKMFPAYGLLGFFFPLLHSFFSGNAFYVRWLAYACTGHILEYMLGAWLLWRTDVYHWRHTNFLNVGHHTDITLLPIFFFASGLFEWVFLHVCVRW